MKSFGVLAVFLLCLAGARGYQSRIPDSFNIPLPYAQDALEPHYSAETVDVHYNGHHKAYETKLIKAMHLHLNMSDESTPNTLFGMLTNLEMIPDHVRRDVRVNAGGCYNHNLFWMTMHPDGGALHEDSKLASDIVEQFGGLNEFVTAFTGSALKVVGSGWTFAYRAAEDGKIKISNYGIHDSPIVDNKDHVPFLVLDVWEHSYYLQYKNKRHPYIEAWWNVVNWDMANKLYSAKSPLQ